MKKFIVAILAFCITITTTITSFAATRPAYSTQSQGNIAYFTVEPTYQVTIPADATVIFDDNKATTTDFGYIEMTDAKIAPSKKVVVSIASDYLMKNSEDKTKTIPYSITSNNEDFSSISFYEQSDKVNLQINVTAQAWAKAYSGNYSDIVTFTVAYV